jgi:hypothetical protein
MLELPGHVRAGVAVVADEGAARARGASVLVGAMKHVAAEEDGIAGVEDGRSLGARVLRRDLSQVVDGLVRVVGAAHRVDVGQVDVAPVPLALLDVRIAGSCWLALVTHTQPFSSSARSSATHAPISGEVYQPEGLRCLTLYPLDPPDGKLLGASGQRGEFPRTPGFGRLQFGQNPVLVYGRVPRRAAAVRILVPGRRSINARLHVGPKSSSSNFYAIAVKPPLPGARVNWFGENGKPGSRGIALMPPITR